MNSSSQWVSSGGSLGEHVSIKRLMRTLPAEAQERSQVFGGNVLAN